MSPAILPHTIRSIMPPEAVEIAVLFPRSMPADPVIMTAVRNRIGCCARAAGGRVRMIHGARKT
jgi:hypothetical protein